jgi:hypothetical protein
VGGWRERERERRGHGWAEEGKRHETGNSRDFVVLVREFELGRNLLEIFFVFLRRRQSR